MSVNYSYLLHDPANIVRWALVALGVGSNPNSNPLVAWPIYKGVVPPTPDDVVMCFDQTGQDTGRDMITGIQYENPGAQVLVRSRSEFGAAKARAIKVALDQGQIGLGTGALSACGLVIAIGADPNVGTPAATYLVHAFNTGPVLSLGQGKDQDRRYHWSINLKFSVSRTA